MDSTPGLDQLPLPPRNTQRVPRSCLQCSRRKIKCSKRIPCEACTRRGDALACTREVVRVNGKVTMYACMASFRSPPLPHVAPSQLPPRARKLKLKQLLTRMIPFAALLTRYLLLPPASLTPSLTWSRRTSSCALESHSLKPWRRWTRTLVPAPSPLPVQMSPFLVPTTSRTSLPPLKAYISTCQRNPGPRIVISSSTGWTPGAS